MYEVKNEETIKKELLDRIPSDIDKSEGSFIYDAIAPVAIELAQTYIELDSIIRRSFIQTSYGEWLDMKANEFGLSRREGTKATGTVTITGKDDTFIPKWTLVQTESGLQFYTTEEAIIKCGSVNIGIEAFDEGSKYNIPPLNIKELPIPIYGAESVRNDDRTTGGSDVESDEELAQRLLFKVRSPATSGNIHHYRQWALDVAGIGDAKVIPLWEGPGTVKVSVIDIEKLPASRELVENVSDYIGGICPIGASVTVEAAEPLYIGVKGSVTLELNYTLDLVIQGFKEALVQHFKKIAFRQDYVSYAQIGAILLDIPGVIDHTNLLINNIKGNIKLEENQVPVLDEKNILIDSLVLDSLALNPTGGEAD